MSRVYAGIFAAVLLALCSCDPVQVEFRSRGVMLRDGTVVHYLEAGQGPVLVLIHGLGMSAEAWRSSMRLLATGYRVVAPDLPGYGKSDRLQGDHSLSRYAAVIGEFIDTLGADSVALGGSSLGGWMAALVALERPEQISHLVLVGSAGLRRSSAPPVPLNPGTREEQRGLLLALFADPSFVSARFVDEQWSYRKEIRSTVAAVLDSLAARPQQLDGRLKDIKVPTLIIWGKQDRLIPVETADRFVRGIPGAKVVVIDDAGHVPQIEKPHAFARAVKGFIRTW